MRIVWKPAPDEAGASIVLAQPSPARGPGSMIRIGGDREFSHGIQAAEYPGAEVIEVFDRQNLRTAYSFTVHATFDTYTKCQQFVDDIGAKLVGRGILELSYTGGGQRSLLGVWTSVHPRDDGVSAIIQYSFLGGAFSKGAATNIGTAAPL